MGIDVSNDHWFGDCYRHISEKSVGVNLEGNGELVTLSWKWDRRRQFYTLKFTESVGNSNNKTSIQIFTMCSI